MWGSLRLAPIMFPMERERPTERERLLSFNPFAFRRATYSPFAFRRGWCGANFVLVMKTASIAS